jgi:hypothetical protein
MITFKRPNGSLTLERLHDLIAELKVEAAIKYDDSTLKVEEKVTLYQVYALGKGSGISKIEVTVDALIHQQKAIGLFIYPQGEKIKYRHYSLCDMGIIDNEYNDHQTFESPILANLFLEDCKKSERLEKRIQLSWRDMDSWESYGED